MIQIETLQVCDNNFLDRFQISQPYIEGEEELEREASENENEGNEEGENQAKQDYVKKEFIAKPWVSEFGNASENEVKALSIKNSR